MSRAPKGTPTGTNLFVLAREFATTDRISNRVESTTAPHMRRLLEAGLIEGDRTHLWLTPAGIVARDAEVAAHKARMGPLAGLRGLLGVDGPDASLQRELSRLSSETGVDLIEWLSNAEARAELLAKRDAAVDPDGREGWLGGYERQNLSPEEYGGAGGAEVQRATYELNERLSTITGESEVLGDPHGSYGPAHKIDTLLEGVYYHALVAELRRLRPGMREAGDEG